MAKFRKPIQKGVRDRALLEGLAVAEIGDEGEEAIGRKEIFDTLLEQDTRRSPVSRRRALALRNRQRQSLLSGRIGSTQIGVGSLLG